MGFDTDIRRIAKEAAREVLREELQQFERARTPQRERPAEPEPLLAVEEVARLCGVGAKTVQRWIAKGLLRALRSPGMREYRVARRDYEAFTAGTGGDTLSGGTAPGNLDAQASTAIAAALAPRKARR